jgi:hypothetical protein
MFSEHSLNILNKIIPTNCEAYLKSKGWRLTAKMGNKANFFQKEKENGKAMEVFVPLKVELGDYKNRISDLLTTLQKFEERPLEYIANDIVMSNYDILRITAFKGDTTASLPLEVASVLLDRSLTLITSAAQSLNTPQAYFSRPTKEVSDFISKLRLGHTERGSFIISIQTPIAPNISIQGMENAEEDLFERLATTRLCSLIPIATSLANATDSKIIEDSIALGISANFIEALADITNICGESGAFLDMAWASVRPCRTKSNFHVHKEMAVTLHEIGKVLKVRLPEDNVEVKGYVTTLHRPENSDIGNIKIITDDSAKIIHVDGLDTRSYEKAAKAHMDGNIVVLKGDMQKTARKTTLANAIIIDIQSGLE